MIVKSLTRKDRSFGQLLKYIASHAPPRRERAPVILHNLAAADPAPSLERIEAEFRQNARHLPPRKNGVVLYHEVLSLGRGDRERVAPEVLVDLALRYLELRAPQALAYGQVHLHTGTPHVHLMISGNLLESGKKLRLSRAGFARVKLELERYQRERYPELEHSRVDHDPAPRREQGKPSPSEQERRRRLQGQGRGEPSRRELLRDRIVQVLSATSSAEAFFRGLREAGLSPYVRGRALGIRDPETGHKHRLRSLGLELLLREASGRWRQLQERVRQVEALDRAKFREFVRELGFRDDIESILTTPQDLAGEPGFRLQELGDALAAKRQVLRERTKDLGRHLE